MIGTRIRSESYWVRSETTHGASTKINVKKNGTHGKKITQGLYGIQTLDLTFQRETELPAELPKFSIRFDLQQHTDMYIYRRVDT